MKKTNRKKIEKKIEKKLTKLIVLFFAFSVLSLYGFPKNERVAIFIPNKDSMDFSKYNRIVIQEYKFDLPDIEIEYKKIYREFFLVELQKNINKEVVFIDKKLIDIKFTEKNPENNKDLILEEGIKTDYKDTLLITSDMILKVDERHVISEEKDKFGDVAKSFVKKIVWNLKTSIGLIDINSGKIVKKIIINKKISEKGSSKQFYFKNLFDATMDDFLKKIMKKGHFERRYLLSQLQKHDDPLIGRNS